MTYTNDDKTITVIDLKTTTMTFIEVLARIEQYKSSASWGHCEFYLDGDDRTIRAREVTA